MLHRLHLPIPIHPFHITFGIAIRCVLLSGLCGAAVFPQEKAKVSLDQERIVRFVNQTITWRQQLDVARQSATDPADVLYVNDNEPIADQIVRHSFDFARSEAQLLDASSKATRDTPTAGAGPYQTIAQVASKLDDQTNRTNTHLEVLLKRLNTTSAGERKVLESAIAETRSELDLLQTRRDVLHDILRFIEQSAEPGGLAAEVDALEHSVPEIANQESQAIANGTNQATRSVIALPNAGKSQSSSIWSIARRLSALSDKLHMITAHVRQTDELTQTAKRFQDPLRADFTELTRQSQSILNRPDSREPGVLVEQKAALDALTNRYKVIGNALLPLSKEIILLEVYKKDLANWYGATKSQYSESLKSLLIRLLGLGALLAIMLGVFELWRRAIFRYIQESHRRYQFLLLRRIALWFVIGLVILLGLVSELGSLATFAGLLTAGVAVGLQTVILAIVGYFLLIGKFGVRVGDRVQVSGVNGEVVDIGLIRLYVMELAGAGSDAQPTGRVVAFSNSIVFQTTPGLFKQVPGTSLVWHEVSLTFAADGDYHIIEQRMLAALDAALRDYCHDLEQLRLKMEASLSSVSVDSLASKLRFRLTSAGLEVQLRFPVESGKAAEIDDRVTRELLHAIESEPKLKVVAAEVPAIRLATGVGPAS